MNENKIITDRDIERFSKADKLSKRAGIYITVIFHLVLVIVLLIFSISTVTKGEVSFITDSEGLIQKQKLLEELEGEYRKKGISEEEIQEFISREYKLWDGK